MDQEEVDEKMTLYDEFYKEADGFSHLCGINNERCVRGIPCCGTLMPDSKNSACLHLDPKTGCRIKSLKCKLWFCGHIKSKHPEIFVRLLEMNAQADKELPGLKFYQSREEYLNYLLEV
jgi:hypothetical protein